MPEAELHFIKARLRGGILSKARRGELITPLPVGLACDAAGHVIPGPDTAVRGAVAHLFTTFEATGSASACVKAFNTAGLSFPWRHRAGPRNQQGAALRRPRRVRALASNVGPTPCGGGTDVRRWITPRVASAAP